MPYELVPFGDLFKVCKKDGSKCFSNKPIPLSRAKKQMKAIIINELKGGAINDTPQEVQKVKTIETTPLGDDDIRKYLPNAKILTYPELSKYDSIEEILPNDKDYFIVLYLDSPTSGHWITVLRDGDTIEYFDSYGKSPDNPLKWLSKDREAKMGEKAPYLGDLLKKTKLKVIYNKIPYQSQNGEIQTCGRHALNRILSLLNKNMDGGAYHKYMNGLKKKTTMNFDELVSAIIQKTPLNGGSLNNKFFEWLKKHKIDHQQYMRMAKESAKKAGYDQSLLTFSTDGIHKLDYNGTKFGRVGYKDYIIYKLSDPKKAEQAKERYHKSHSQINDDGKFSPNQLSLKINW